MLDAKKHDLNIDVPKSFFKVTNYKKLHFQYHEVI
jgi:hypothetical protein